MYIDEELANIKGTVRSTRKNKLRMGIEEFIDNRLNNEKVITESYKTMNNVFKEDLDLSVRDTYYNKEDAAAAVLTEAANVLTEDTEELFLDLLSETVLRALNIGEKLIEENRAQITEKTKGFYKESIDIINLEGSQVVVDLINNCRKSSTNFDIEKHDALYEEVDKIALIIKNKVANVITEEKQMSKLEIMKEDEKYSTAVDIKLTLFKEMEIENVKQVIKECADKTMSKENILLASFYETVVDYTLLETFNTLRMIEFNNEMYEDRARKNKMRFDDLI